MAAVKQNRAKKRTPLRAARSKKASAEPAFVAPKDVPVGAAQKRYLRGLGHALQPVVQIGKHGVTEELIKQTQAQLLAHELIKLKLSEDDRELRAEQMQSLAAACAAVLVQQLGRTALLYKRHPQKPQIALPRTKASAPKPAAP